MVQILVPLAIAWLCIRRVPMWESRCGRDRRRREMREPFEFPPRRPEEPREPAWSERIARRESAQQAEAKKTFPDGRRFGRIRNPPTIAGLSQSP